MHSLVELKIIKNNLKCTVPLLRLKLTLFCFSYFVALRCDSCDFRIQTHLEFRMCVCACVYSMSMEEESLNTRTLSYVTFAAVLLKIQVLGMSRCVQLYRVTYGSNDRSAFIFRVRQSKKTWTTRPWRRWPEDPPKHQKYLPLERA